MSSTLPRSLVLDRDPDTGLPIMPSQEVWASLRPEEQERITLYLMEELGEYELTLPPEGTPHANAQRGAFDRLRGHFDKSHKGVFLASNLMVHYPSERPFAPDLMAVLDVSLHDRMSWSVSTEGKGPDFVLEILFSGNAKKDLRDNVAWLARLGIPEYFVFEGGRRRLHAWRLPPEGGKRYAPVLAQGGRYGSVVLGMEFAVVEGALKVYQHGAEVPSSAEEIVFLSRLLDEREAELRAEAERAKAEAERAQAEVERAQAEVERAQAEAERAQAETERAETALGALRTSLLAVLEGRGLAVHEAARARIAECRDPERLGRWIVRAITAASAPEALD